MQYLSATLPTLGELQKGSTRLGTSLNKIFVAAALMALAELSGQQKVSVEWTFNGRDENWKTDLIGLTLSAIPVAVDMGDIHSPQDILREINEQNELGMRYADLSLGNNGVTPGDRDRMIVVYESGFNMNAFLPEGTEVTTIYDKLSSTFTRFQIILFDTADPDSPIPFYINYNSKAYSIELVERFCESYNRALMRMIMEEKE